MHWQLATNSIQFSGVTSPFDCELGRTLLRLETPVLEDRVRRLRGDTMLWCGVDPDYLQFATRCMVRHRFQLVGSPDAQARAPDASVFQGQLCQIPLANQQMDGVVLHHALDVVADPRTAIREAARVIAPGGSLLICGLNPASLTGLRAGIGRFVGDAIGTAKFVLPLRLLDWLSVLGFVLESPVAYMAFRPPWGLPLLEHPSFERARCWLHRSALPFGGVYVVEARKQALGMRPLIRDDDLTRQPQGGKLAYPKISAWTR